MRANQQLVDLITNYHELNASVVDEFLEEPSPLEFMRYVAKNRPFVVRGGALHWKACQEWDAEYLRRALKGETVNVAVTPSGYVQPSHEQQSKLTTVQQCGRRHRAQWLSRNGRTTRGE
jgi:jumonji domain-containing protein 7